MRASSLLATLALVAGCSKPADKVNDQPASPAPAPQVAAKGTNSFEDCTKFVTKAQPVIEEMTKQAAMPFGNGEIATFVRQCSESKEPREKLMDCVLAAADEPAVRACYTAPKP